MRPIRLTADVSAEEKKVTVHWLSGDFGSLTNLRFSTSWTKNPALTTFIKALQRAQKRAFKKKVK